MPWVQLSKSPRRRGSGTLLAEKDPQGDNPVSQCSVNRGWENPAVGLETGGSERGKRENPLGTIAHGGLRNCVCGFFAYV